MKWNFDGRAPCCDELAEGIICNYCCSLGGESCGHGSEDWRSKRTPYDSTRTEHNIYNDPVFGCIVVDALAALAELACVGSQADYRKARHLTKLEKWGDKEVGVGVV
jgi:hypothetical protein